MGTPEQERHDACFMRRRPVATAKTLIRIANNPKLGRNHAELGRQIRRTTRNGNQLLHLPRAKHKAQLDVSSWALFKGRLAVSYFHTGICTIIGAKA
ncbi:hypothetical protein, partial [Vogesella indigofera]|uniref:hypothetical protein n=1 Tax=Vogesella indigofera TaxID=45465 RepID=UPI0035AF1AB2